MLVRGRRGVFAMVLVARAAHADGPTSTHEPGPELSLRLGPSFVAGEAEKGQPLGRQVGAPLSFMLDGGYRANERLYFGGFWAMGFGLASPRPCPAGFSCDPPGLISNIGAGARLHPLSSPLDPWVGAGLALDVEGYKGHRYEDRTTTCVFQPCTGTLVESTTTRFGASLLLEGGFDIRLGRRVGMGAAVAAFAGKYLTTDTTVRKEDNEIPGGSGGGANGGYHLWLLTSARVVVTLP